MSLENNTNESDYDQNSLAEKFIISRGLSAIDDSEHDKRRRLLARFDIDNIIYLIKRGLLFLNHDIPVECALDIGCGEGCMCQVMIEEKLAHNVVGIDKSKQMIEYAKLKCENDNDKSTRHKYMVIDAANDLKNSLDKKFPLIIQAYMLCHAENVNQLSQILSNIFQVCNGVFVGLLPSPSYDHSNNDSKIRKYGIKQVCEEKVDGQRSYLTLEIGTPNEITLIDHWYSAETYERLFKEAGFNFFEWVPANVDQNKMTKEDQDYLADLANSGRCIGFIAALIR
jgi:SAM-dependent methyltransferase